MHATTHDIQKSVSYPF